jgi:mono/diheme cytochrome c family protein
MKGNKMNRLTSSKLRLLAAFGLVLAAAAVYALTITGLVAADPKPETQPQTGAKSEKEAAKKEEKKKSSGDELYRIHCNRCHAERYATERTDAQWRTIMMHMQTRAQLPGRDAKAILKYLQENN